jgi:hypothetical protein
MKVCRNCHTENPPGEAFCSECGMSLMRALTVEAATRIKEGRRAQLQQPVSASGIVYLFGEQFAKPWGSSAELETVACAFLGPPEVQEVGTETTRSGRHAAAKRSGEVIWRSGCSRQLSSPLPRKGTSLFSWRAERPCFAPPRR